MYDREELKNSQVLMIEFAKGTAPTPDKFFPIPTPESLREVEQQIMMEYV